MDKYFKNASKTIQVNKPKDFNWFENYCQKYSEKLKEHKEKANEN